MGPDLTRRAFLGLVAAGSIGVAGVATLGPALTNATHAATASQAVPEVKGPRIKVTLAPFLAQKGASKSQNLSVPFHPGITPKEIAEAEGFQEADLSAVMAAVNGTQIALTAPLSQGDHLRLIIGMAGG